ncbi:MAG TPA: hypothetical protein VE987_02450 [Polyangiaceae bacterium]|nr:hypothetical protein [Polyangiaceae bacterium]
MNRTMSFAVGFAAGWLARSTAQSSHEAAVAALALVLDIVERVKRAATLERERFEDWVAEARAQATDRGASRSAHSSGPRGAAETIGSAE